MQNETLVEKTIHPSPKTLAGHFMRWFVTGILLLTLSACAGKFTKTTEADLGFFADNTIAMMREANLGFSRGTALYTKEFYDLEGAEEKRFIHDRDRADYILKLMVQYSIKLVNIGDSEKMKAGQVKAYADYLAGLDDKTLTVLELEKENFNDLINKIRKQTTLLDALQTAQPLVNTMGRYMGTVLDDFNEAMNQLVAKTEKRIDRRYELVIRYQKGLEGEKYAVLQALGELYSTVRGDDAAYRRLLAAGTITSRKVIPRGKPTEDDLLQIYDHLVQRLNVMNRIGQEIETDWEVYRATQRELDDLHAMFNQEVKQVRLITIVWMRAHQKMASGKVKPAEWFDINNAPGTLIRMGTGLL